MKVLMVDRSDSKCFPGGDTMQLNNTASALRELGMSVDITNNVAIINVKEYDVVHVFNLMRPLEAFIAIEYAERASVPVVFSSIYWDFDKYNKVGRENYFFSLLHESIGERASEALKELVRGRRGIYTWSDFWRFFPNSFTKKLEYVSLFLPNSKGEGDIIRQKVLPNAKFSVVFNAVDPDNFFIERRGSVRSGGLSVCRIDPRKNLHSILEFFNDIGLDVYGSIAGRHRKYAARLMKMAGPSVSFKGPVEHDELRRVYNRYKFHILPSWLETPGLSQLEAAACGCNIISTVEGSAPEYFGEAADYVDPNDCSELGEILLRADQSDGPNLELSEFVRDTYTWRHAGIQTLRAYEQAVS